MILLHQSVVISLCLAKQQKYKFSSQFSLKSFVDQVESIEAVEANFNLLSLFLAVMVPPRSHRGVELKSLLVSARREDTLAQPPGPLHSEGPLVPGTADT